MLKSIETQRMLENMSSTDEQLGTSPKFEEMPRLTLANKGINGPTAAHKIEELHTPLNVAYTTYTTGTTAFQNIVGVTFPELDARRKSSKLFLKYAGLKAGDKILVTYPPVLNVFPSEVLKENGIQCSFLRRSSRNSFLCALHENRPRAVLGESSFFCSALKDAEKLSVAELIPHGLIIVATGAPLDLELLDLSEKYGMVVHDLYGCQEFGWLALDGLPLRNDVTLVPVGTSSVNSMFEIVVGGLPTGDRIPVSSSGHACDKNGKMITYRNSRSSAELDIVLKETTLSSANTAESVAKSILRLKSKVIRIDSEIITGAAQTRLDIYSTSDKFVRDPLLSLCGPDSTELFDSLVKAQLDYQRTAKTDPAWVKRK